MIPTRLLVVVALPPLALAVAAILVPGLWIPLVAYDLVLALVAALDLALAGGAVDLERRVQSVQAVGRPFPVTLVVRNRGRRALELRVNDAFPGAATGLPDGARVAPSAAVEIGYRGQVDARGRHAFGPVTVRWRSPLGLWERQRSTDLGGTLKVYPNFAQLARYGLRARIGEERAPVRAMRRTGGESEFRTLRPYVPGDPYRHVDWKATARRRHLVTREFGQERNQNVVFLLDCGRMMSASSGALTLFDHGLDASMIMGQTALRHGDRVGVLAFDHRVRAWLAPRGGARTGGRLIRGTYDLFPTLEEPDYGAALRALGQRVRRRSLVVLITAVADEVNAELATSVVSAMARRHLVLTVWLRDEGVFSLLQGERSGREVPWERAAAASILHQREQSLAALRRRGALVVDVPPAKLTAELLGRYLEIKSRRLL